MIIYNFISIPSNKRGSRYRNVNAWFIVRSSNRNCWYIENGWSGRIPAGNYNCLVRKHWQINNRSSEATKFRVVFYSVKWQLTFWTYYRNFSRKGEMCIRTSTHTCVHKVEINCYVYINIVIINIPQTLIIKYFHKTSTQIEHETSIQKSILHGFFEITFLQYFQYLFWKLSPNLKAKFYL